MKNLITIVAVSILLAGPIAASAAMPPQYENLVEIKPKRLDKAWLLPGADFREYRKIQLDTAQVAFHKDWMRNLNTTSGTMRRVSTEDAQKIAAAVRDGIGEIFAETFRKGGYELTREPGPDVLRLSPYVIDLYINAPDTMTAGRTTSFTVEAGQATIILEARDSLTGALLGVGADQRTARNAGGVTWATSVTNRSEFRRLFQRWADICVQGMDDLRANSPLPADMAGKKLPGK